MTDDSVQGVKAAIASILEPKLLERGITATDLRDDLDLRQQGIIDSLGFIQLLAELEIRLGREIDLVDLAPEQITQVGALARHLAARYSAS